MQKILMSACFLGEKVRYDGKDCLIEHPIIKQWVTENRIITICPEMAGGLPTPRPPAEINGLKVITNTGIDVTKEYQKGARLALDLCQQHNIKLALLKANSPSCGNLQIYDGSYTRTKIAGQGITAALLIAHGIKVFNEDQLEELSQVIL